jgi:hypothetical protein
MEHTIEQYLMALTGASNRHRSFEVADSDRVILTSISRQTARGIALTDRQYELVKTKLVNYRDQFERNGMIHLDLALETLAKPLRTIDRSQTITVEDDWLAIKFPFNKKTIAHLESGASKYRKFYRHEKGSNVHYFKLYEPVINDLVEMFKNKKFDIDPVLIELSDQIGEIKSQELLYVPHVSDHGIENMPERAVKLIQQELGDLQENKIKYWDRSIRYGYKKTAQVFRNNSQLAEHVANRTTQKLYLNPAAYGLNEISQALKELDRFPLVVTLNRRKEFEELKMLFDAFDFVDPSQQILLSRVEDQHDDNYAINTFIKDKNFNNWLDNNIKIVYIFKNTLPKLLLRSEWKPSACLTLNGEREHSNVAGYVEQHCDLIMIHDSQPSYWSNTISRQLNEWV